MKVTLSFETTLSEDVSVMVDLLRASTTITFALDKFERIIPCFTPGEAFKLKEDLDCVIAGERMGEKIEGFDMGNSPTRIESFETDKDTLVLTTSNGTRILEAMNSKVLVGCLANARAVGEKSAEMAKEHIDVVMAGVRGEFALEDFLASGEILYWICQSLDEYEINDLAKAAIIASRDHHALKAGIYNSRTGKHLSKLGHKDDINLSCQKNISDNVAIYENHELRPIKD